MAASSRRQRWQTGRDATDRRLRLQIAIVTVRAIRRPLVWAGILNEPSA